MSEQPVGQPLPIRLEDDELIALGAYIRSDMGVAAEAKAQAVAVIGMKLTRFFMDVAKVAVEHYDREYPPTPTTGAE